LRLPEIILEAAKGRWTRQPPLIHIRKEKTTLKFTRNIGMLLLAIFLIAWGLFALIPALSGLSIILAILAIAAGIFILLGR
jgi:hypothetical protein